MNKEFNLNEDENFKKEDIKDCIVEDIDFKDGSTLNLLVYIAISILLVVMSCFNGYCMGVILFHKSYKNLLISVFITIVIIYNTSEIKDVIKEDVKADKCRHEILKRMSIAENIYGIVFSENEDPLILLGFKKKKGNNNRKIKGTLYEKIILLDFDIIETDETKEIKVSIDKKLIYIPKGCTYI